MKDFFLSVWSIVLIIPPPFSLSHIHFFLYILLISNQFLITQFISQSCTSFMTANLSETVFEELRILEVSQYL